MTSLASTRFRIAYIAHLASQFGECRNVLLTSTPSPDRNKSVVSFRRECGVTVAYSTHASIAPIGGAFSPETTTAFFSIEGVHDIVAIWRSDEVLKIGVIPGANWVFRSEQSAGNVRIEYE
jgi:hypothetical protein